MFKVSSFRFQVSFPFFTFPCARFIREYLKLETRNLKLGNFRFRLQIYCTNFALCEIERDSER